MGGERQADERVERSVVFEIRQILASLHCDGGDARQIPGRRNKAYKGNVILMQRLTAL